MLFTLDQYPPKTNYVCSNTNSAANLIAFGDEVYNQYLNSGCQYIKYIGSNDLSGYVAYKVEDDKIDVQEVYFNAPNINDKKVVAMSLLQILSNDGAALKKPIHYYCEDKDFETIIRQNNQLLKEQKVEDKYWWKII